MMETNMETATAYRTSDMYFAAFLKVAGCNLVDSVREDSKVVFLFEDQGSTVMRDLKRDYFSGAAKVSAQEMVQAIKTMKSLTHM
jgi:hypothetical protein